MRYLMRDVNTGLVVGAAANFQDPADSGRIVCDPQPVAENNPELVAYLAAAPTADQLEAGAQAFLASGVGAYVDAGKLLRAKFISDLAFRLGKTPASLTAADLTAERNRIAAIYKAL